MGMLLGSYLKEPITEKISSDESSDKLNCGASSMQGWRVSQEDAHNCLLDFDVNTSLFAVYDGHGGHEVAEYCSSKLPQFIKDTEAYKKKDYENALIDAFLGFDATINTPEVIEELKVIAKSKENDVDNNESGSDVEENVSNLYEEATMPLEQVMEKYTSILKHPHTHLSKDGGKLPISPCLRARKEPAINEVCSSSTSKASKSELDSAGSSSSEYIPKKNDDDKDSTDETQKKETLEKNGSLEESKAVKEVNDPPEEKKTNEKDSIEEVSKSKEIVKEKKDEQQEQPNQNGEVVMHDGKDKDETESPSSHENGEVSRKGKGKDTAKGEGVPPRTRAKRIRPTKIAELCNKLLEFNSESDEDSENEEDKTFQGPTEESSSDDDNVNKSNVNVEDSDATSEDEEAEDEEDDDSDDEEDIEEEEDVDEDPKHFHRCMSENPGSESGCTAVVALLHENELYVANAGDSRCIVCRNGEAVEMSIDHKPEDKPEFDRIVKAGGEVYDGRVNGGLNLSRAIGDHHYKQTKDLTLREQMITSLPDVRKLTINPGEDEFMVLACDGIWNFMTSQQVVEFVRPRIKENAETLSKICEEMFEHCLAPNTLGDGTGCDNMTAMIIKFKNNLCKRSVPSDDDSEESQKLKRVKTDKDDGSVSQTETVTA